MHCLKPTKYSLFVSCAKNHLQQAIKLFSEAAKVPGCVSQWEEVTALPVEGSGDLSINTSECVCMCVCVCVCVLQPTLFSVPPLHHQLLPDVSVKAE